MSNREFTATRTMLANAFATAGAELLEYMGTAAALAAIPDTSPQRYVVAGTLAMIGKVLPKEGAPAAATVLTDERIKEIGLAIGIDAFQAEQYRASQCSGLTAPEQKAYSAQIAFARAIEAEVLSLAGKVVASEAAGIEGLESFNASRKFLGAMERSGRGNYLRRTDVERLLAHAGVTAEPAAPVQRIPDMLTVETIQGAIAFGRMGINPPPSPDHWGNEFWQIGRQLAKLSETSAWDNVTPVDVGAQVPAAEVRAAALEEAAKLVDTFVSEQMDPERMECGLLIADTIRSLAHQSTADKASEVRAAEVRVMPEVVQSFALEDGRCVMGDPDLAALKDGTYWICKAPIYHAAPSTADSAGTGARGEKGADRG